MNPPFFGTKVLDRLNFRDIVDLVDKKVLFASRWQFENLSSEKGPPVFERIVTMCEARGIIEPKIVYGYFECKRQESALLVSAPHPLRFEFPRQRQPPHLCVADFFPDGFITMQLVTIGDKVIEDGARLFNEKKYADVFYLKGFAAELAEATAEYGHRYIFGEFKTPSPLACPELSRRAGEGGGEGGMGCRISFGYPAAPHLMDQEKLYALLDGERIGVKLTETFQLVPEYSTSAIISFDPNARMFRP